MFRVAFKNLLAHKFRSLALVFTVVLGVSFVVGTYVLTDTITNVFNNIFSEVYRGTDVTVRHTSELGLDAARPPIPETLLADVQQVDGVRVAEGDVFVLGVDIIDADGDRVGNPMAPSFGTSWTVDPDLTPWILREGRPPVGINEVAIDAQAYETGHFRLGDTVKLVTSSGPRSFTLVGVAGFGRASNLAGATISIFDLQAAQEVLGRVGQFDSINIAAEDGVSVDQLQERVGAVLGRDYEAINSTELTNESNASIASALGYFRTFMLVFAFIALFVGVFIIYNTYSIVIFERTRELALVRALGASGLSVMSSVLAEALITGFLAAGIGLGAGVLIALALRSLLDAVGFSMPTGDLVLLGRTVLIALVGGPLITALASVIPAIRASRVAPVVAMSQSSPSRRNRLLRNVVGSTLATAGVALVLIGLDQGTLSAVGVGVASLFIGVAVIAPLLSRPVATALGAPVERGFGVTGMLARQNASRTPRRTGATASALMIGTALMAGSFILSRSITESVDKAVTGSAVADLVIATDSQLGFSAALAEEVAAMPAVRSVAPLRVSKFKIGTATKSLLALPTEALDASSVNLALDVGLDRGDITQLPNAGIAVQTDVARDHDWAIGDVITATMPTGDQDLRLVATYEENTLVGDYVIDLSTFDRAYSNSNDLIVLVGLTDDSTLEAVKADIKELTETDFPGLRVEDREEYVASTKAQVAQFTNLITALLVLAVFIALLGVLITLLLSVSERTRELGLLRAVGMSRRQTRATVRWEAAIVSLFGAMLGLGLGTFFGLALVRALRTKGVTETVVPIWTLVVLAGVIALLGVAASVYPARRAARLNVITAVASL